MTFAKAMFDDAALDQNKVVIWEARAKGVRMIEDRKEGGAKVLKRVF